MSSFDLLSRRRPDWKPQTALVVSPYVEADFFETLARDLKPKRLHVVIDDGCRREDLDTVRSAVAGAGAKRPPTIRLGSARGLVHLKLFYVRWETSGGRSAHTLVFGSANATRQGFGGDVNAELLADCRLTRSGHPKILAWCEQVINATQASGETVITEARDMALAKGVALRLPSLIVGREVDAVSDFDGWIQRGVLLSTHRPDAGFLRIPIPFARPLSRGEQGELAAAAGFDVPQTRSIRHRYLDDELQDDAADDADGDPGNWRRRLFTRTQLGDWCSETCFQTGQAGFKRRHHEAREAAIAQLRTLVDQTRRSERRAAFLKRMEDLWNAFGDQAGQILEGDGALDRPHYAGLFDARVDRDLEWIEDKAFVQRFVSGYEFVDVPRFRNDVVGWRRFVASWAEELAHDQRHGLSQSHLLKALRAAAAEVGHDAAALQDPRRLTDFVRGVFRKTKKSERRAAALVEAYPDRQVG